MQTHFPRTKTQTLLSMFFCTTFSQVTLGDIGDGPRAYLPPPVDTNVFTLYGMQVNGNSMINSGIIRPNLDLDIDLAVAQYTRTMAIAERYVSITAVQPVGTLNSKVSLPNAPRINGKAKSKGLGDTQLLLSFGVYNLPPLTKASYRDYKPSFAVGAGQDGD